MSWPSVELRHLRAFVAVAEERHFGRAALRLHMAQPAVSKLVKQLEEDVGVLLLERTTRRVDLTNAGEVYLEHIRTVLADLERGRRLAQEALHGERGVLRVGITGILSGQVMSRLSRAYRDRHQAVDLVMEDRPFSGQQESSLLERTIDVAFTRYAVGAGPLSSRKLLDEPIIVCLPDRHPLAAQASIRTAQLVDEDFVTYPAGKGSQLRGVLMQVCSEAGFAPRIVQTAEVTHMLLSLVGAEIGVAVLTASVERFRVDRVVYRALDAPIDSLPLHLTWRTDDVSPVLARFLEVAELAYPTPEA